MRQIVARQILVVLGGVNVALPALAQSDSIELHGQATYVRQAKPAFSAQYSGPKSFSAQREYGYSFTATAFLGARLAEGWEAYLNPELARGVLLSSLQGLGGFHDGESQRSAGPVLRGYRARAFARKTWNLGGEIEQKDSQANQVRTSYAARRFVLTAGNFSVLDVFDAVEYSREPRTQFLNWAALTYGAWDYPADARGYTWGAAAEYITPSWSLRAGRFLMPRESNGLTLNNRFMTHYGDAVELERPMRIAGRKVVARALAFHNRVHAGAFRDALDSGSPPDITSVRHLQGKSGVGASAQAELTPDLGAYVRAAWNDGKTETYAFTEIDRSLAAGLLAKGSRWGRSDDSAGVAGYVNALSKDRRSYLAAGGLGFFLGDGRLDYAAEKTLEAFYSIGIVRGAWLTMNVQRTSNPGYNRDRGPAQVYSVRAHFEY